MRNVLYRASAAARHTVLLPPRQTRTFPTTGQLLVEGGDARIALDPYSGANRYGCTPFPDPGMAAYGSTTASAISDPAFRAADRLRDRLAGTPGGARAALYVRELERMRLELAQLSGAPGAEIIFAASGTDIHLIAASLVRTIHPVPPLVIMIDGTETGAGVPAAVTCRHFSSRSARGDSVAEGGPVGPDAALPVATVAIRRADGSPLPSQDIDAAVEKHAMQALARGRRVLLVLNDLSKTGMLVPSPACMAALRTAMPDRIDVLVDACQFRIAASTVRAYLEQGFMVALTGSKFLGGPSFSGALLIPQSAADRFRQQSLGRAMSAYSARAEWPRNWQGADLLDQVANPGLLLRWEAALAELRALRAVPETEIRAFLRIFATAIAGRLADDPLFRAVPVPDIDRRPLTGTDGWDSIPTIFPFLLRCSGVRAGTAFLGPEETQAVYRLIRTRLTDRPDLHLSRAEEKAAGLRCQLGQPVVCGSDGATPLSALRLSVGARQIIAATREGRAAREIVDEALTVLDKTAWLVRAGLFRDLPRVGDPQPARHGEPAPAKCAAARSGESGSTQLRTASAATMVHRAFGQR